MTASTVIVKTASRALPLGTGLATERRLLSFVAAAKNAYAGHAKSVSVQFVPNNIHAWCAALLKVFVLNAGVVQFALSNVINATRQDVIVV